jgi:Phage integrase family
MRSGRLPLRSHDLRHFAGTTAAAAGASTKEVMARGGWSSPQMALRYEHATEERDRFIAHALEALSRSARESLNRPLVTRRRPRRSRTCAHAARTTTDRRGRRKCGNGF